jgi:hypothetical protein
LIQIILFGISKSVAAVRRNGLHIIASMLLKS